MPSLDITCEFARSLPTGVRKEVEVDGRQVLLFWYRNQICAIEARSPAEGAYSEGFIRAKFTQASPGPAALARYPRAADLCSDPTCCSDFDTASCCEPEDASTQLVIGHELVRALHFR